MKEWTRDQLRGSLPSEALGDVARYIDLMHNLCLEVDSLLDCLFELL